MTKGTNVGETERNGTVTILLVSCCVLCVVCNQSRVPSININININIRAIKLYTMQKLRILAAQYTIHKTQNTQQTARKMNSGKRSGGQKRKVALEMQNRGRNIHGNVWKNIHIFPEMFPSCFIFDRFQTNTLVSTSYFSCTTTDNLQFIYNTLNSSFKEKKMKVR